MIISTQLVSIIIPVYKVQSRVAACLDSILLQTYSNLEIILIDDGSPDRSPEICDAYANKDNRVRVIHQENKGVSAARNAGLKLAHGALVTFVDSDDILEINAIELMVSELDTSGADAVRTTFRTKYNNSEQPEKRRLSTGLYSGERIDEVIESVVLGRMMACVWTLMIKTEILKDDIHFDTDVHMMEDVCFYIDVLEIIDSIFISDKITYKYLLDDASASRSPDNFFRNANDILLVNQKMAIALSSKMESLIRKMNATHVLAIIGQIALMAENRKISHTTIANLISPLNENASFRNLFMNINTSHLRTYNKLVIFAVKNSHISLLKALFSIRLMVKKIIMLRSKPSRMAAIPLAVSQNGGTE